MQLDGSDLERLRDAIVDAYDVHSFEEMLRLRLNRRLDTIVSIMVDFSIVVFYVLKRAEQEGWLQELIAEAPEVKRGNTTLVAVRRELLPNWPEYSAARTETEVHPHHKQQISLPTRNRFFRGYEKQLQQLQKLMSQTDTTAVMDTHAISGLGGVGKTALAVEFAHRFQDNYEYILFCSAESVDVLNAGYAQIARKLYLPEKDAQETEAVVQGVRSWLQEQTSWLLILDYVDFTETFTAEMLSTYLPDAGRGHILLTSRAPVFHGSLNLPETNVIHLEGLLPEDAVRFLIERPGKIEENISVTERAAITTLALELGYLPLALEQAAAYIAVQHTTFQNYLPLYQKLLHTKSPETGKYPKTVKTTWQINFERAAVESKATIEILEVLAFLAPEAIPAEVILADPAAIGPKTKQAFRAAIKTDDPAQMRLVYDWELEPLVRYSLITKSPEDGELSIHRLVQAVVRDQLSKQMKRQITERAAQALLSVFPEVKFENWDLCERLLPHAQMLARWIRENGVETVDAASLLNKTGLYLDERGLYQEAEPHYQHALKMHRSHFPPYFPVQPPDVADNLNDLAALYQAQRRFKEALPLYERALSLRRASLPARHLSIAQSLNNLALLYRDLGRFKEAEALFEESRRIYRSALAPDHPHIATCLNNLALLYHAQERYTDALPLYEEALTIYRSTLSDKHPDIASCLHNMARLYKDQGHFERAESLYKDTLKIRRDSLTKEHPDIASSLSSLAVLYNAQNRFHDAEPLLGEALEIAKTALGEDHPTTRTYANNLENVRKCL